MLYIAFYEEPGFFFMILLALGAVSWIGDSRREKKEQKLREQQRKNFK